MTHSAKWWREDVKALRDAFVAGADWEERRFGNAEVGLGGPESVDRKATEAEAERRYPSPPRQPAPAEPEGETWVVKGHRLTRCPICHNVWKLCKCSWTAFEVGDEILDPPKEPAPESKESPPHGGSEPGGPDHPYPGMRYVCRGCGAVLSAVDGLHGTHLNYDKHALGDWCGPVVPEEERP